MVPPWVVSREAGGWWWSLYSKNKHWGPGMAVIYGNAAVRAERAPDGEMALWVVQSVQRRG